MAIVVETGAGLANAESYCSVAFVDAYASSLGRDAVWTTKTETQKEQALREAMLTLDGWERSFLGCRVSEVQALAWPRSWVILDDGFSIAADAIPTELKKALAELALATLDATAGQLVTDATANAPIVRERVKAGPVEEEIEYGSGGKDSSVTEFRRARLLLRRLMVPSGTLRRA